MTATISKPTATFDKQGGYGGSNSTLVDYNRANPNITIPQKSGCDFEGYYTGVRGTGTKYYNSSGVSVKNWAEVGGKTLYANWVVRNELVTNGSFEGGPTCNTDAYLNTAPNNWVASVEDHGLSYNGSYGLGRGNTPWTSASYAGYHYAYVQKWGALSQSIDFPVAGKYRLSFAYAARPGYNPHYRAVKLGDKQLLAYTASNTGWQTGTVDFDVTAPGPQTLSFCATSVDGDKCSCIDAVSVTFVSPLATVTDCSDWRSLRTVLETGYSARLVKDIAQDANGNILLNGTQDVTLDLNGHAITSTTAGRLFNLTGSSSKLTITDSVGGGVIDGQNVERTEAMGACAKICSGSTFNFESGSIRNFNNTAYNGGAIYNDGTVTMNGGSITNCAAPLGGAIYQNSGTVTMNDGVIEGCSATTTGDYNGGGAVALINGSFTMNGGTVRNNQSNKSAGAFYGANGSTLVINGGTISGNYSPQCGGVFYGNSTITVNGGDFYGNTAKSDSVFSYSGSLVIYGGVFTNNVGTTRSMTINSCQNSGTKHMTYIYGGVIDGSIGYDVGANQGDCIWIYGGVFGTDPATTFSGRGLASLKNTKYTLANGKYLIAANAAWDDDDLFTGGTYTFCPTNELYTAAGLAIADDTTLTGSGTSWTLKSTNAVEVSDWTTLSANLIAGNNVKLAGDVTQNKDDGDIACIVTTAVTLDLNGYTLYQVGGQHLFGVDGSAAKLTVTDNSDDGAGEIVGDYTTAYIHGRAANIYNGGELILEKGTIRNFNAYYSNGSQTGISAILLQSNSKMTMNGGVIKDCKGNTAGAVYVSNGATFTMTGGTITNCMSTSYAGGVCVYQGKMTMTGGKIVGNTSMTWGGGVFVTSGGTMSFTGGEISYNTSSGSIGGGGICSSGKVTMTGGTVVGNKSTDNANSTAFYSNVDDSDMIYGGVIDGTIERDADTGDIYLYGGVYDRDQTTLCASGYSCYQVGSKYVVGKAVSTDSDSRLTGGSYTFNPTNAEYAATGIVVADSAVATGSGTSWALNATNAVACSDWAQVNANICAGNNVILASDMTQTFTIYPNHAKTVTLDMNGHTVSAGVSNARFFLVNNWYLTVKGEGVFDGSGHTCNEGHFVCVGHATSASGFTMEPGVTVRNMTSSQGGAYRVYSGYITMNGGTVTNCVATDSGGGGAVYSTGTFTMNGGTIVGCSSTSGSGGAIFAANGGTAYIYGGSLCDNSSRWYGGAIYGQSSSTVAVYGGYFRGNNTIQANGGQFLCIDNWVQNGNVYGGVFDGYDPQTYGTDDARAIKLQNAKTQVGTCYVIGANMTQDADEAFVTGQFTFPITNELYTAHGVAVAEGKSVTQRGSLWCVVDPTSGAVPCGAWAQVNATLTAGFDAIITNDITDANFVINLTTGQNVAIDLNGHSVMRVGNVRVFAVHNSTLTIKDSAGNGRFYPDSTQYSYRGAFANITGTANVIIESGTIDGFSANGASGTTDEGAGGVFEVQSGSTLTMNGGTIKNCKAKTNGGAVDVLSGGTFTMNGGTIEKCSSGTSGGAVYNIGGTFTMKGGLITGCSTSDRGGAIQNKSGNTYIYGCISNCTARCAGGVSGSGGTVYMYDGAKIVKCYCSSTSSTDFDGSAALFDGGHFTMYGGHICDNGGTASVRGFTGVVMWSSGNTFTMYGGVISNNTTSSSVAVKQIGVYSGTAIVKGGLLEHEPTTANIQGNNGTVTVSTYRKVGDWYVVGTAVDYDSNNALVRGVYTFCPTNAIYSAAGLKVNTENSTLEGANQSWRLTPNDGEPLNVSDWAQLRYSLEAGFDVKLTNNIAQTSIGQFELNGTQDVTLDLNGFTITRYVNHWFGRLTSANAKLTITDSSEGQTGTVAGVANSGHSADGSALRIEAGTVIVNGGTFKDLYTSAGGGWAYVASGAKLVINGGTITNCKCGTNGGGVYVNGGTVEMYGGTIEKCTGGSGSGGAFRLLGSSKLTIYGGKILDNNGNSYGGVCIASQASVIKFYGGYYKGNYANAGNFYVRDGWGAGNGFLYGGVLDGYDPRTTSNNSLTLSAGVQQLGTCYVVGNGVAVSDTALTGGKFYFAPTNSEYSAIAVANPEQLVADGGDPATWTLGATNYCICGDLTKTREIPDHTHADVTWYPWSATSTLPTMAGNYYLTGDVKLAAQYSPVTGIAIDLAGHSITQTVTNARVINLDANVTFTLTDSVGGGKVTGGNLTSTGGDVSVDCGGGVFVNSTGANFIMYGGSICGNSTKRTGGGIYAAGTGVVGGGTSTIKIYGGAIENNQAETWGGGMCLSGGTQKIRNCTIRNNTVVNGSAGAVSTGWTSVSLIDCVITNNTATSNWAGYWLSNGTTTELGGTMVIKDNYVVGQSTASDFCIESGLAGTISTTDPLENGAEIGVTTDVAPAAGAAVAVTGVNDDDYVRYFFSDKPDYIAINDANTVKLALTNSIVAKIGETPYTSVQYAINSAAEGETVTVVKDVSEVLIVDPGKDVELDLNGHAVAVNTTYGKSVATIKENGKLTLTDTSTNGCIKGATDHGVVVNARGEFTMDGGVITNCTSTAYGGGVYNAGTFTMNAGTITKCSAAAGGGLETISGSTTTINGGSFIGNSCTSYGGAIHAYDYVDIYGGYYAENSATTGMPFFDGDFSNKYGNLYGGVWKNLNPTNIDEGAGACDCQLMDGAQVFHVDDLYIVGKAIRVNEDNELTRGVTTFCATNAEYVAGGLKLADGATSMYRADAKPMAGYIIAPAEDLAPHEHCLCGDKNCTAAHPAAIDWIPWIDDQTLPIEAGHFYTVFDTDLSATYTPVDGTRLCLNGKTVKKNGGTVAVVGEGRAFTLTDCRGTGLLTGGNDSDVCGSGVQVQGEFDFFGGSITGNVAYAGAIAMSDTGRIVLGGRAIVTNNPTGSLFLADGQTVEVSTNVPFVAGAVVAVTAEHMPHESLLYTPVTATNGSDSVWFICDDPRYAAVSHDGKVQISAPIVTYEGWGGTTSNGTETIQWSCPDRTYEKPADLSRTGYEFRGLSLAWTNGLVLAQWEDPLLTNGDHTVYALWESIAIPDLKVDDTLKCTTNDDGVVITGTKVSLTDGKLTLPDVTSTNPALCKAFIKVADYAFNKKNYDKKHQDAKLTSVAISVYVKEIGSYAFQNCTDLTNVTFATTRDYTTGAKVPLVIRDWAFYGSKIKTIRFPAGASVLLDEGAFAFADYLEHIYIDGEVKVANDCATPFANAARKSGKVTLHLAPSLAADADYVYSLTNGMNAARVELSQDIEGEVGYIGSPDITSDPMVFNFSVSSDSPWLQVNADTVYLFWSKDLSTGIRIGNEPIRATSIVRNYDGTYTAKFPKPEGNAGFFQLCVGE